MPAKRKNTYNEGANDERSAILAKVRRMKKAGGYLGYFDTLEAWLLKRNERYNAKPGGLGRK